MSIHPYEPIITVKSTHDDRDLALYAAEGDTKHIHLDLGDEIVTTSSTNLAPLAKAILNAVEPEALVENQTDAEPEPYKPQVGDRVLVTAFHDADPWHGHVGIVTGGRSYGAFQVESADKTVDYSTVLYPGEFEPAPETAHERDLAAEIDNMGDQIASDLDNLTARVAALEVAADPEIRVGDTVRVEPDDWNIPTPSSTCGQAVTGKVISIVNPGQGNRYLTEYRSLVTGNLISIYAVKATKVVSRG